MVFYIVYDMHLHDMWHVNSDIGLSSYLGPGSPIIFNIAVFKSCQWHHISEQSVLVETGPCWKRSCWDSLLIVFEWLPVQHGIVAIINSGTCVVSSVEKLNFQSAIRHVTGGPWCSPTRIPILLEKVATFHMLFSNEKPWLFRVYKGIYYPVMWDYNKSL